MSHNYQNVLEGSECISWTVRELVEFEGVEEENEGILGDKLMHAHVPGKGCRKLRLLRGGMRKGLERQVRQGVVCSRSCLHLTLQVKAASDKLPFLF